MEKNKRSVGQIRKEIQTKLFIKFLKKEKQYLTYTKVIKENPQKILHFNESMYDYIFILYRYNWDYLTECHWRKLRNKWYNIVDNYKKIKKSNYKIYGK